MTKLKEVNGSVELEVLGQKVTLSPHEYYKVNDSNDKIAIRNAALQGLAVGAGLESPTFEFIESVRDFTSDKFSYVVLARMSVNGKEEMEIGESNYLNSTSEIARLHPATVAKVRATSRVLIKALGLQGYVYSEDEIEKSNLTTPKANKSGNASNPNNNPNKPNEDKPVNNSVNKPSENPSKKMTKEEAGEVPIIAGYLLKEGKKVKDCKDNNVKWLMSLTAPKYNEMKEAIKIYFDL